MTEPIPLSESPVGKSPSFVDVLRSIRRWFGVLLPEPWDLQFQREDAVERPTGFVVPAIPAQNSGSAYVRNELRDFDVFLYPDTEEGNPALARVQAEQLAEEVKQAMTRGIKLEGGGYYSRTMRLPVYDYEGIAWDQTTPDDVQPFDLLPVSNFDVEVRIDPDDDTLFTVVVSLRLHWVSDGDTSRLEGATLQDVIRNANPA